MTELQLTDVQGFVARGYRLPFAGYLFLRVDDSAAARRWLAGLLGEVLSAAPWTAKPDSAVNLASSYAGLRALGVPDSSLASFPEEFREGMAARSDRLGDTGASAPEHWEAPFGSEDCHLLVMISAKDAAALQAHDRRLREAVQQAGGLSVVGDQLGAALPGGVEHFGFADGFAQPAFEGSGVDPGAGGGAPANGGWRAIATGEFVLGYLDEEGTLPQAPTPDELSRNGSYLVYRKLQQHVAAFRRQLADNAALFDGSEELLGAKLVGRWRDGTPLDLSPAAADPSIVADGARNNAFSYRDDPQGKRCPIGSHVRRVNPRESLPFKGKLVNRHRLIRRGIPYGDPLPEGAEDDGRDRGVVFMCLQASIARQFEFVQSQWLGDGNALRQGDDQDVLIGPQDQDGARKLTIPGEVPFFFGPLSRMVSVRGGGYFFCPGINGLRFLAALEGTT